MANRKFSNSLIISVIAIILLLVGTIFLNQYERDYFLVIAATVLLIFVLFRYINRIEKHVNFLRDFALKAEKGEDIEKFKAHSFPDDELGDISNTITNLYAQLRDSEEDKLRLKRQLTQNAAHELKTPAASVNGYLETIVNNPDMDEQTRRHFIERSYAQSKRMCKLLSDMSTLTRLDEARSYDMGRKFDINEIIAEVLRDSELQLKEKGISVTCSLPENLPMTGDPTLIESVFRNIIDNSLAYAVGCDNISIVCFEIDGMYEFSISDNGKGVESESLPHLFERFYRADKGRSRNLGGTGLGLAIVKNAVTLHGGSASASPTPGGGLTIKFSLRK